MFESSNFTGPCNTSGVAIWIGNGYCSYRRQDSPEAEENKQAPKHKQEDILETSSRQLEGLTTRQGKEIRHRRDCPCVLGF
ncbi:hypothetical protein ACROYT_G026278 [Oculina patagonica]